MLDLPARISDWLLELVRSRHEVAHLFVDGEQALVDAGGNLEHYGLTGLAMRQPVCDQLPLLEGMLPLPESPFLLQSIGMPSGRVADIHFFADEDATWIVLLDVTTEHDDARKMQQKAYDMTLLSQREARLIAKLEAAHRELTLAHRELGESREALLLTHNRLQKELRNAERYVRATLPEPLVEPFAVDWRFVPSNELGGDSFGYHWIDPEHFAVYLLDVCGHGVGSALLSVAANNTLRSGALLNTDFRNPEQVLEALNRAFPTEKHADLYFTIWYGVYHRPIGRLRYATAGHPPAIVVSGPNSERGTAHTLRSQKGLPAGAWPDSQYRSAEFTLVPPARFYLFSDGVYEVSRPDGSNLEYTAFEDVLTRPVPEGKSELDELLLFAREFRGDQILEDDFSIVKMTI